MRCGVYRFREAAVALNKRLSQDAKLSRATEREFCVETTLSSKCRDNRNCVRGFHHDSDQFSPRNSKIIQDNFLAQLALKFKQPFCYYISKLILTEMI